MHFLQLTKERSISRPDRRRFVHQRGHYQFLRGVLHAVNGDFSSMVVVFL